MKCLGVTVTKEVKDLCNKNFKTQKQEIEQTIGNWVKLWTQEVAFPGKSNPIGYSGQVSSSKIYIQNCIIWNEHNYI